MDETILLTFMCVLVAFIVVLVILGVVLIVFLRIMLSALSQFSEDASCEEAQETADEREVAIAGSASERERDSLHAKFATDKNAPTEVPVKRE